MFKRSNKPGLGLNGFPRVLPLWAIATLVVLGFEPQHSYAWSSVNSLLTDDIHQLAIANAIKTTELNVGQIATLQDEQGVVDKDQKPEQSDEHSMTGVTKADQNLNPETQKANYIARTEGLLRRYLSAAVSNKAGTGDADPMHPLGKAVHAMQDATSPQHRPFQRWSFDESLVEKISHVWGERLYPSGDFKRQLECATRLAYEIYAGKLKMPDHFFNQGQLDLTAVCPSQ